MVQVMTILGLMMFMWAVAVYATFREEEPPQKVQIDSHQNKKAA